MPPISHSWSLRKSRSAFRISLLRCRPRLEELESRCQPSVVNPALGTIPVPSPMLTFAPVAQQTQTPSNPSTVTTSPTPSNSNTAVSQLQPGNTGIGGTLPAGLADASTLANLSEGIQQGNRNIGGLPFNSPTTPPLPPPIVPPPPPLVPHVQGFPLPTGGGGGLTGPPANRVNETELRFEEEEEDNPQVVPNPPNTPQAPAPEEVGADLPFDLPSATEKREPFEESNGPGRDPLPGYITEAANNPLLRTDSLFWEDSKPDLSSVLTALAIPLLPSLASREGLLKDGKERVPVEW